MLQRLAPLAIALGCVVAGSLADDGVARTHASAKAVHPPSASEFGRIFVASANRYGKEHGDRRLIDGADCVQAAPGRYMCSYSVSAPGSPMRCELMQARWTPRAASTITVTLAGRVKRCGSLREALRSL